MTNRTQVRTQYTCNHAIPHGFTVVHHGEPCIAKAVVYSPIVSHRPSSLLIQMRLGGTGTTVRLTSEPTPPAMPTHCGGVNINLQSGGVVRNRLLKEKLPNSRCSRPSRCHISIMEQTRCSTCNHNKARYRRCWHRYSKCTPHTVDGGCGTQLKWEIAKLQCLAIVLNRVQR